MIDIVINDTKWSCPTTWNTVSIGKTIELQSATSGLSESIIKYIELKIEPKLPQSLQKSLTTAEKRELLQFYCDTLSILCGIPPTICAAIEPKQIFEFIETHLLHLIVGIVSKPLFTPTNVHGFDLQGEWFALPKTEIDHSGEQRPCAELSAEEFCLATDLYVANRVANSARIIATVCRPEGEEYCRKTATERIQAIKSIPMSIAWEVFTLLTQAHKQMSKALPHHYNKRAAEHNHLDSNATNSTSASWQQIPIVVARGVPSEVAAAQKMKCYQLMQMLALSGYGEK